VLRRHAHVLGSRLYYEKPRRFVRRVGHLWRSTNEAPRTDAS
jgi:hypothetical protein